MVAELLIVDGTSFELTLLPIAAGWQWLAARRRRILLSGEAPTRLLAREAARATAAAWVALETPGPGTVRGGADSGLVEP